MRFDSQGRWLPPTSPRQDFLRSVCRQKLWVLANGCRLSTKTMGCLHMVCDHAWNIPAANICMVTISQTVGFDSGIWPDLTAKILPAWLVGNFGMDWIAKPYIQGISKKPTCEVRNRFGYDSDGEPLPEDEARVAGGVSTIQLESLKVEDEAEDRFKPRRYSMIYVPELSTFHKQKTFATWTECLRHLLPNGKSLPREQHLFLADTNPADEGEESWIYKLWFDILEGDEAELDEHERVMKKNLARVDFTLEDNIFDSPERIADLKSKYAYDPDLYERYIHGKWVGSSEDAIFSTTFRPLFHVLPLETEVRGDPDPPMMMPEPNCIELFTGSDPGTANYASVIVEKIFPPDPKYRGKPAFKVLDEVVHTGGGIDLDQVVSELMEKMAFWQAEAEREVRWTHWSDRSVFDMRDLSSQKYYHEIIFDASGGTIELVAAERGPDTLRPGIELMKMLLFEERLWINAARCPKLIAAFKAAKRGNSERAVFSKGSKHKHPLDALRYVLQSECYAELSKNVLQQVRRARRGSTLVSVPV